MDKWQAGRQRRRKRGREEGRKGEWKVGMQKER